MQYSIRVVRPRPGLESFVQRLQTHLSPPMPLSVLREPQYAGSDVVRRLIPGEIRLEPVQIRHDDDVQVDVHRPETPHRHEPQDVAQMNHRVAGPLDLPAAVERLDGRAFEVSVDVDVEELDVFVLEQLVDDPVVEVVGVADFRRGDDQDVHVAVGVVEGG